jgi:hypothetical protein
MSRPYQERREGESCYLVGPFGNGVGDVAPPQPGADGFGAVALVAQDMIGSGSKPSRADARNSYRIHHGGELGAVGV